MPQLIGMGWETYAMVAAGLANIYFLPCLTTGVPSPLVAIAVLSAVATAATVVGTHDLSFGALLPRIFFTGKVRTMFGVERLRDDETATSRVTGQIFFASVDRFSQAFGRESERSDPGDHVVIDVTRAHS